MKQDAESLGDFRYNNFRYNNLRSGTRQEFRQASQSESFGDFRYNETKE